jgi:hypothetical protein
MAISTYAELQTAVQNWLDNTNTLPAARVEEFIALAEADINRRLRTREMLTTATGTTATTITLPADYGSMLSLSVTEGGYEHVLAQMDADAAIEAYYGYGTGIPQHFVVEGGVIRLYPAPGGAQTYTLRYYARVPALTALAPTNWLLTAHPDVYLFGSLVQAELFNVDDPRVPLWQAKYDGALEQVRAQGIAADMGGQVFMYFEGGTP